MLYSIAEISEKLNVSKVTIYKKLKSKDLIKYIVLKNNVKYLDTEGFELLKECLQNANNTADTVKHDLKQDKNINDTEPPKQDSAIDLSSLIDLQQDYINTLKQELQEKNNQINNLQVSLRVEQQKSCENYKLMNYIAATREQPQEQSFWKKMFTKK